MARPDEATGRTADAIEDLALRLDRLRVSRHDPEAFFEERSEIVHLLRCEAVKLRCGRSRRGPVDTRGR